MLRMLLDDMDPKNIIAEAELNDDGLYEVMISRDSTKALSVSVFPRVASLVTDPLLSMVREMYIHSSYCYT